MTRNLIVTFLRMAVTVLLAVGFVFLILRVSGDPIRALLPLDAPEDLIELTRKEWGLDQPLHEQFFAYVEHLLRGDFGRSLNDSRPALQIVLEKVPATLLLMGSGLLISLTVGTSLGVLAASHRGKLIDRLVMTNAVLVHSIPSFLLGIVLILVFAVGLGVLPSGGGPSFAHLVLPAIVIGLSHAGVVARFVRSSTLEVLAQPYVKVASLKPLPAWYILAAHVLPGTALPLLTLIGFSLGAMIGGAAIVESIFAWPGVGRFLVSSVARRDVAVVQTIVILVALMMAMANLLVDILYLLFDPRLRDPRPRS
ncbi:MAG: ABC transporter permease [Rhodospirillales bacterium]|nr:ABC transporter permease [Rhodospirillales bacterium]